MKKFWTVGLALAAALAIAPVAKADSYNISITGTGLDLTGTIAVSGGVVTSISLSPTSTLGGASISGSLVTGLGTPGSATYEIYGTYQPGTGKFTQVDSLTQTPADPNKVEFTEFDNKLNSSTAPYFDGNGILISLGNGGYLTVYGYNGADYWNEYTAAAGWLSWTGSKPSGATGAAEPGVYPDDLAADVTLTSTNTVTPEPSSLLLLGTGLLSLAGILFWKAKPNLVKAA